MSVTPRSAVQEEKGQLRAIRGAARRAIWLPFIIGFILIVALVVAALTLPDTRQTSLVADFLLVFVLCPVILCALPVYLLMVVAVYGMGRVTDKASRPLMALERLTAKLGVRTERISERMAKASITFNARMASIDRAVFSIFDERPEGTGKQNESSASKDESRTG